MSEVNPIIQVEMVLAWGVNQGGEWVGVGGGRGQAGPGHTRIIHYIKTRIIYYIIHA